MWKLSSCRLYMYEVCTVSISCNQTSFPSVSYLTSGSEPTQNLQMYNILPNHMMYCTFNECMRPMHSIDVVPEVPIIRKLKFWISCTQWSQLLYFEQTEPSLNQLPVLFSSLFTCTSLATLVWGSVCTCNYVCTPNKPYLDLHTIIQHNLS